MRLVRNAAQSLPVQRRDEFLQRLAAQLTSQPSDAAVQAAVTAPQQRRRTPMKRHYRPRDDDDDIVPDGGRVRVPLTMMDSVQRAVTVAGAPVRDGQGGTAGLHRPGVRLAVGDARARKTVVRDPRGRLLETREEEEFEADDAAMDARDAAYAAYDRRIAREYLNPGFDPSITGQRAGDLCTINGTPGHLRMVNGALQCVPDRSADAAPVEGDDGCPECEGTGFDPHGEECEACSGTGYEQSAEEVADNVAARHESTRRLDHRQLSQSHQQRMARLYDAYDAELRTRYKG